MASVGSSECAGREHLVVRRSGIAMVTSIIDLIKVSDSHGCASAREPSSTANVISLFAIQALCIAMEAA